MEVVLVLIVLLVLFALGPVAAMLHFVSGEMGRLEGPGVDLLRIAGGVILLWIPFAWIVYFLLVRRRPPLA